ncbi:MAG: hypothetical protein V4494_07060 [Chlamydiota bacterium]
MQEQSTEEVPSMRSKRDRFFSSSAARLFFLFLLVADALWAVYNVLFLMTLGIISLATGFKFQKVKAFLPKTWISFKRSLVCGVALMIALISPSFGILIACTYFLTYDPSGIEEVVPSSLRAQFKEFFQA